MCRRRDGTNDFAGRVLALLARHGLVDGLVRRVRAELPAFAGDDVTVIATGDSAPLVMPESETIAHLERDLALEGLRIVYERTQVRRAAKRSPVV